jgi:murein DD-endopeptidase MepM/ murein hydrolase activator NlpD
MRKKIPFILFLICLGLMFAVGNIFLEIQIRRVEKVQKEWSLLYQQLEEEKENLRRILVPQVPKEEKEKVSLFSLTERRGGAETDISRDFLLSSPPPISSGFLFPIKESDFLSYSSFFGERKSPFLKVNATHLGVDIVSQIPEVQIIAVERGEVVDCWPPPGTRKGNIVFKGHPVYGGLLVIEHPGGWKSLYAHLSEIYVDLGAGKKVQKGQVIGRMGDTGLTTGEHLHFELYNEKGELVNPLLYLPLLEEKQK